MSIIQVYDELEVVYAFLVRLAARAPLPPPEGVEALDSSFIWSKVRFC